VEHGVPGSDGDAHPALPPNRTFGRFGPLVCFFDDIAGFCLAALLLFLFAPLMGFLALAVRLDSPGPVFLKEKRQSWRQREIGVFVFRTLRQDKGDPRGKPGATRIGGFLRDSSLDQLPRLLNIAHGGTPLSAYGFWLNGKGEG